uniref:CIMAP1 family member D n=1 Tax=Oncorhynchus mykiss TaxID=8022 RepID=A0A8K9WXB5_ONCMY
CTEYIWLAQILPCAHTGPQPIVLNIYPTGPGPGRYALPPTIGFIGHDFTKPTSPAYSFHGRMNLAKTPGPGRYNSTDPSVYLPRQPAFSMLGRHGFPNDKVTVHKPRAPAFSLGIRHSEFVTPLVVNVAD